MQAKTKLFIATLIFGAQLSFFSQEKINSNNTSPSDAPSGYTYDFNKAQNLIIERLIKPSVSNKEAEILVAESNFPKLSPGEKIDTTYKEKLRLWMEKNPNLIISAFMNRKDIVQAY